MQITIREFKPGDEPLLRRAFCSSVHGLAGSHYTAAQLDAWAPIIHDTHVWAERMRRNRPNVAMIGNTVAGYADLQPEGYIDHFFVAAEFARHGIGSALMRHLHQQAHTHAIHVLTADVSLNAEAFFLQQGFVIKERQTVEIRGIPLKNARMQKVISNSDHAHH